MTGNFDTHAKHIRPNLVDPPVAGCAMKLFIDEALALSDEVGVVEL